MIRVVIFALWISLNVAIAKMTIESFKICEEGKNYTLSFVANFTNKEQYQLMDLEMFISDTLDNQLTAVIIFEYSTDGVNYKKIFSIKSKLCDAVNANFGDFAYKILRSSGINHKCPIPRGNYIMRQQEIDFRTFRIPQFPAGHMRTNFTIVDRGKNLVHCSIGIIEIV